MGKFMRSRNGLIVIIAGVIIVVGLIGITIYYATSVSPKDTSETTVSPSTTEPTTSDSTSTEPEPTKPPSAEPDPTDPPSTEPEPTDPPIIEPEPTVPPSTEPEITDPPSTEPTTTEPPNQTPKTPLIASTDDGRVVLLDLVKKSYTTLVNESRNGIASFEYYLKNQTLFYATLKPNEPLKSSNEYYGHRFNYSAQWTKKAMAIDVVTDKVYLLDRSAEKLYVMDINNDRYSVVLTDLDKPKDIILDPARRLIFILQDSSILQAHMDGQEKKQLVEDVKINAFAIDCANGVVYYASDKYLKSINYVHNVVASMPIILDKITSMTISGDQLVYIGTSADYKKTLRSCLLSEGCMYETELQIENEENNELASKLSVVKIYNSMQEPIENPCEKDNGGCSHLCVLNAENYSCGCNAGWQLNNDSKTCSLVEDYLLYIQDGIFKGRILDPVKNSFVDLDLHIGSKISDPFNDGIINFDYDSHQKILVSAAGSSIQYLNVSSKTEMRFDDKSDCVIIPVIDWVSKNLYHVNNCAKNFNITVRNLGESFEGQKTITDFKNSIKALIVLPNHGKIFFTTYKTLGSANVLHSLNLNGTRWTSIYTFKTHETGLTVDYDDESIYFLDKEATSVIKMNIDTLSKVGEIDVSLVKKPRLISAFQKKLYVANETEIWRFEENQSAVRILQVTDTIQNFKIYSKKLQPSADNPCANDKGGCQRYCFAAFPDDSKPTSQCFCNDNEVLQEDGKTCKLKTTGS